MYTIYKISNTINDKIYIGQTRQSLKSRMNGHKQAHTLIGIAIRKYGIQNFTIECIDTAENNEQALYKEKHYIGKFDCCYPSGYNSVQKASIEIQKNMTYVTISKNFICNNKIMEWNLLKYIIKLLSFTRWDFYIINNLSTHVKTWTNIYKLCDIRSKNTQTAFKKFCEENELILSDEENNKYVNSKYFVLCEDNDI